MIEKNNFKNIGNNINFYLSKIIINIKKNKLIFIVLISFILFFSLYVIFSINLNSNQNKIIEKLSESLLNDESKVKINNFVMVNEQKVSNEELKPLVDYYKENKERIKKLINTLKKEGKYENFNIIFKKEMFYKRYYININTVEVELNSNLNNIEVEFGNKNFKLIDNKKIDIIPGIYEIKYTYKTEYGDIIEKINLSITKNEKINLNVNGNYITLYSNFSDSEVFINDKNTGLLAKDINYFGPIPKNKKVLLKLRKQFPWGIIESEEVDISNEEYLKLNINMANDNLIDIIKKVINEFYGSVFEGLNKRNKDEILNCNEEVKKIVYNYINEKTILLSNNYEINDINVEIEKSDFKYENSVYKASILSKVSYNINKKILSFLEQKHENYFLLDLEYINNNFKITGIQKVNIN